MNYLRKSNYQHIMTNLVETSVVYSILYSYGIVFYTLYKHFPVGMTPVQTWQLLNRIRRFKCRNYIYNYSDNSFMRNKHMHNCAYRHFGQRHLYPYEIQLIQNDIWQSKNHHEDCKCTDCYEEIVLSTGTVERFDDNQDIDNDQYMTTFINSVISNVFE
jgi:hypothetical protein